MLGFALEADPVLSSSTPDFQILWSTPVGAGDSHMMVIRDGVIYAQVTDSSLIGVRLHTGEILARAPRVSVATAPFVVGDWVYSWKPGALTELDRFTLQPRREFPIYHGSYFENIPYDRETDAFYVRLLKPGASYPDDVAAYSRADGRELWSHRFPGRGWTNNNSSPLLPGDDSVYVQCAAVTNWMYRLDKRTGAVRWVTELGISEHLQFNNPIYDAVEDQIVAARINGAVFALRRSDGTIRWQQSFPRLQVRSTLTTHAGMVYVPLWNPWGTGAVAALDARTGEVAWIREGFFGEDGWSAMAVCDRYLYRSTHGTSPSKIVVQDRRTGDLVWSADGEGIGSCTNPILSDGIVVFGTSSHMIALRAGRGLPVDCAWHGVGATGANPGAILWDESDPDPDSDADGLSDVWEAAVFGHLFHRGTDDPDGDGLDNATEFRLGLDPLTAEPRDVLAQEGEAVRFVVATTGGGSLRFQWRRNGAEIPGATNAAHIVQPVGRTDDGSRWSVRIESDALTVESRAALLTVVSPPTSIVRIDALDVRAGRVIGTVAPTRETAATVVQYSTNLLDWTVVQHLKAGNPTARFTDFPDSTIRGYYRVVPGPPDAGPEATEVPAAWTEASRDRRAPAMPSR